MDAHMTLWIFIIVVVLGFAVWALLFRLFRHHPPAQSRASRVTGYTLFGPFWPTIEKYMSKRGWKLSEREMLGWLLVFLLMIAAILFTYIQTDGTFVWK